MREQLLDLRTVWMRAWFSLSCAALRCMLQNVQQFQHLCISP